MIGNLFARPKRPGMEKEWNATPGIPTFTIDILLEISRIRLHYEFQHFVQNGLKFFGAHFTSFFRRKWLKTHCFRNRLIYKGDFLFSLLAFLPFNFVLTSPHGKNSCFRAFLHTFLHRKTTDAARGNRKRRKRRCPSPRAAFGISPCDVWKSGVFRPVLPHTAMCAKIAKRKQQGTFAFHFVLPTELPSQ